VGSDRQVRRDPDGFQIPNRSELSVQFSAQVFGFIRPQLERSQLNQVLENPVINQFSVRGLGHAEPLRAAIVPEGFV
jgi:hypothetical protein